MNRIKLIDISIVTILFLGIITLPINNWIKDVKTYYLTMSVICLLYLVFLFLYIHIHPYMKANSYRFSLRPLLILLPTFIVVISNYLYAWIINEHTVIYFPNYGYLQLIFIALAVIIEEILFRYLILSFLRPMGAFKAIIYSSLLFALFHLSHYFSSFNPVDLIKVIYSFGLGVILGALYYYSHSLIPSIVLHLSFNVLNDYLFTGLYNVNHQFWYYFINASLGIIVAIYLILIYIFVLKKEDEKAEY